MARDPEKRRARMRLKRQTPEYKAYMKAYRKRYRIKNRDKLLARDRKYVIDNKDRLVAYRDKTRSRRNEYSKKWYHANKHRKIKNYNEATKERRKTWHKEHNKKLRDQRDANAPWPKPDDNRCGCCGEVKSRLVYDHDHSSGLFRGWICDGCNLALGLVKDNLWTLTKLIMYLKA